MTYAAFGMIGFASLLAAAEPQEKLDDAFLERLERRIELPAGALTLERYSRSYFLDRSKAMVIGVYSTTGVPGRRWVEHYPGPFIMDGGCAIVTVTVDLATERVEKAECNGVG